MLFVSSPVFFHLALHKIEILVLWREHDDAKLLMKAVAFSYQQTAQSVRYFSFSAMYLFVEIVI